MNSLLFSFAQSIGSLWQAVNRWFLGPYAAAIAVLVLVVLGLVAGQVTVPALSGVEGGNVHIGGDRDPLMASEGVAFVTEKATLMPPQMVEDPWLVEVIREAVCDGNTGHIVAWLYLMMNWWGPVCLVGPAMVFLELYPRLLEPHLLGLVVLWALVAGAVAWGVWWVTKKTSAKWVLKASCVATGGMALAVVTAAGHWLLAALG